jgi:hypothetical protein
MKRFFALFLSILVFSSCDDGDLTQVSFEFDDTVAEDCGMDTDNFFIFKTQDRRALIIQLPESSFENLISVDRPTPPLPLVIDANSIRLIYREYSDEVSINTFCSVVPVAYPAVVQEREATEGKITITTTAIRSEPDANGATRITNFLHTLVFSDLKFDLGDGNSQINEAFTQVTYLTDATPFTNFAGLTGIFSCEDETTFLFKFLNTQALILNLDPADYAFLFSDEAGPKRRLFSSETTLTHAFFNTSAASLSTNYFCANTPPGTPEVLESFNAVNGVDDVSGIIEVTTLSSVNGFMHTIVFKNVRLAKGTLNRELGNAFIFGEFETTN